MTREQALSARLYDLQLQCRLLESERHDLIWEAHGRGLRYREIAELFGMPQASVNAIVLKKQRRDAGKPIHRHRWQKD